LQRFHLCLPYRSNDNDAALPQRGYAADTDTDQNPMETFDIHDNTTISRVPNTVDANDSQSVATSVQSHPTAVVWESRRSVGDDVDTVAADMSPYNDQQDHVNDGTLVNSQTAAKSRLFDLVGIDSPTMHHNAEVMVPTVL
jgi:hypothetical protein